MLFLIGMPGTGKTYWAEKLSATYGLPYVDIDAYIELQLQSTISEIFAKHGEDWFRQAEQQALHEIINTHPANTIVSCGGGTPIYHGNMARMKEAGCTVYLRTTMQVLRSRMAGNGQRPLLNGTDIEHRLQDMLVNRIEIYEQAHYILDTENLSTANFAEIIALCTNQP